MPSHCRTGLRLGPVKLQPLAKGSTMQQNIFDLHRAYQVDSCTSTFRPVKDDPSPAAAASPSSSVLQHPAGNNRAGLNPAAVEEVDVETILQLGELQDWTWPTAVEAHATKPTNTAELSLPFSSQSLQLSSRTIQGDQSNNMHNDQKSNNPFAPTETSQQQQSFDLHSWCSGVRGVRSPHVVIPKFLAASGGFTHSAEPSPTTDTSPLTLDTRDLKCSPVAIPLLQRRYPFDEELQSDKTLGVQKKWQGKRAVTQRESHIWSERQRRKGMNHLFSTLRSLLPQPTPKTDKSTVVAEIIKYIQGLQLKLDELNKRRADILRRKSLMDVTISRVDSMANNISSSTTVNNSLPVVRIPGVPDLTVQSCLQSFVLPNVALHISGNNAFITMSSMKKKGIFSQILLIMQSHKLDVVNAQISTNSSTMFHCLHVLAPQPGGEFPKQALQTALQSLTLPEYSV